MLCAPCPQIETGKIRCRTIKHTHPSQIQAKTHIQIWSGPQDPLSTPAPRTKHREPQDECPNLAQAISKIRSNTTMKMRSLCILEIQWSSARPTTNKTPQFRYRTAKWTTFLRSRGALVRQTVIKDSYNLTKCRYSVPAKTSSTWLRTKAPIWMRIKIPDSSSKITKMQASLKDCPNNNNSNNNSSSSRTSSKWQMRNSSSTCRCFTTIVAAILWRLTCRCSSNKTRS